MNTKAIWKKRAGLRSWVNYFLIMVICDAVFLAVAFAGFHIFRRGEIPTFWPVQAYVISFGFCGLALYVAGAYSIRIDKLSLEYATGHLVAFFIILPILLSVIYVFSVYTDNYKPARGVVIPGVATLALVSLGLRRAMESRVTHRRRGRYYAIIGNAHDIRSLWHELLERPKQKPLTPRFFDVIDGQVGPLAGDKSPLIEAWNPAILADPEDRLEGIVMASHARLLPVNLREHLVRIHLAGIRVYTAEAFAESVFRMVLLREVDEEWVLDRELALAQSASYARVKSLIDSVMALILLLFFLPVMLVVGLAILLIDGRPIFYKQSRYGEGGRIFSLTKFRTMKARSEEGSIYTAQKDERVTFLGRILRPTRLDELPQIWNILIGDMSLIGPRAEWIRCVEQYEDEIPFYHLRHEVPPGLTGWAQVNFHYGSNLEDTKEKLRYDLYYIRNHSFLLDFQILLKTVYVVLAKAGGK